MKVSKRSHESPENPLYVLYPDLPEWRRAIIPVAAAMLVIMAFMSPSIATAQAGWNTEQDNCASLYPSPAPNSFEGSARTLQAPPDGWGDPMKDPATGRDAHWSWDGTHSIVACNSLGLHAGYTTNFGQTSTGSRSNSSVISGGYGDAFQDVELVQRYAYARWGDLPSAWVNPSGPSNAANYYFNHPSHLIQHDNGTTYLPAVGDIVVFGPVNLDGTPNPNAGPGHVAIIAAVNTAGTVTVFEQNWGTTSAFHTLQLQAVPSGDSTIYTIGNDVGQAGTFQKAMGGKTYRGQPDHVIYGVLTAPVIIAVNDPRPPTGSSNCVAVSGPNVTSYCDAPAVTITCGGAIGSTTDGNGIPINYTITNGNTVCDTIKYSFGYVDSRKSCFFYFYVPNGHATTTIKATLSNGTHITLDENPVNGWQFWFNGIDITSLTFTDANGTTGQQEGWGRTPQVSLARSCD